jgi:hypothetical protein
MYAGKLLGGVITYGAYSYRFIAFPFDGMTAIIKKWVMGLSKMQDGDRDASRSHRRLYFRAYGGYKLAPSVVYDNVAPMMQVQRCGYEDVDMTMRER